MSKDYYQILELDRKSNPSIDEIKKKYRKLVSLHHPDKKTGNAETFKLINEAYTILSDEVERKKYDQKNSIFGFEFVDNFENFKRSWNRRNSNYSNFNNFNNFENKEKTIPKNLLINLKLKPEDFYSDTVKTLEYKIKNICFICEGSGKFNQYKDFSCDSCGGNGLREEVKKIKVKIPKTVYIGSKIIFSGYGHIFPNEAPGDLHISIVGLEKSDKYSVGLNMDIIGPDVEIACSEALYGFQKKIQIEDEEVEISKEACETLYDPKVIIPGKGISTAKDTKSDYIFILKIQKPTEELLEKLNKYRGKILG